jgi:hypothetical protein
MRVFERHAEAIFRIYILEYRRVGWRAWIYPISGPCDAAMDLSLTMHTEFSGSPACPPRHGKGIHGMLVPNEISVPVLSSGRVWASRSLPRFAPSLIATRMQILSLSSLLQPHESEHGHLELRATFERRTNPVLFPLDLSRTRRIETLTCGAAASPITQTMTHR